MSVADFDERELRIAPVMTGGSSLAIWMGGAAAELYRLLRCRRDPVEGDRGARVYRGLLEATHTTAVVDVITGTSAGGLNGTLLGAAWALELPLATYFDTRETWLELADLEALLRPSDEADPPSLLRGDDYFARELRRVLDEWNQEHGPVSSDAPTVDMVTTVTTVVAQPRSRTDHFGESLSEVDHAQWLRFTNDDFVDDEWTSKLSVAARTSASIPGVFEPSFLPVGGEHASAAGRPDFGPNASFRGSRWAIDGGVVVNLPLGEALDRIYGQSAEGEVRRVVLYICPTPRADAQSAAPDDPDARPTIRESLTTVVSAPRQEGISADVDQLERHNAAVERQARVRRTMASLVDVVLGEIEVVVGRGDGEGTPTGASAPFDLYRAQRTAASVRQMMARVNRAVGPMPLEQSQLADIISEARVELLPDRIDQLAGDDASWGWGIAPVEQAVSIGLGIIGRCQRLLRSDTSAETRAVLSAAKQEIHEARAIAASVRELDGRYWNRRFDAVPGFDPETGLIDPGRFEREALAEWAAVSYQQWPLWGDEEARLATFLDLAGAHRQVANAIRSAYDAIREVTLACGATASAPGGVKVPTAAPTTPGSPSSDVAASFAQGILDEVVGLFAAGDDPRMVQRQLLRVHVAQTLLLGEVESREQRIELMQLSFNSWNGLDPDRTPDDKLAGPELARLGAFLKASWRANDWTWGRMDAAHRLVVLLLDPARLAQIHSTATEAITAIESGTGVVLPPDAVAEFAFLDHRDTQPIPGALTMTARTLSRQVQVDIARRELPLVAEAVNASERRGANAEASRAFATAVPPAAELADPDQVDDEAVAALFRQMEIGRETIVDELGYSLMNRTMSHGIAVTLNALTGRESGLSFVSTFLRPLRAPLQALNSLVSVMTSGSRLARGATAFILAVAGAVVALRLVGIDVPPGTFAIAALLFVGAVLVAMLRSGFVRLGAVFTIAGLFIAVTLVGASMASLLYSTEAASPASEIGEGAVVDVDGQTVLRITRGTGDDALIDDIEAGGTVIEWRNGGAVVRGEPDATHVAGWKRWGFVNPLSLTRLVLAVGAVGLLVVAWRRVSRGERGVVPAVLAVVLALMALALPQAAEATLTGSPPESGSTLKSVLVDVAEALEGFGLEIVLIVMVGVGVAIALGGDLLLRRRPRS